MGMDYLRLSFWHGRFITSATVFERYQYQLCVSLRRQEVYWLTPTSIALAGRLEIGAAKLYDSSIAITSHVA